MASICLKLKAKTNGLISKIKRTLSFNINNTGKSQNKNKHANNIELKNRVSQYSAVMQSPTASPVILPRGGSPRGIK